MMQDRFMVHWDRLVESGSFVGRQSKSLYKSIRSEWLNKLRANVTYVETAVEDSDVSPDLVLFLLVLGFGHTMATLAFAMELFWNSKILRQTRN